MRIVGERTQDEDFNEECLTCLLFPTCERKYERSKDESLACAWYEPARCEDCDKRRGTLCVPQMKVVYLKDRACPLIWASRPASGTVTLIIRSPKKNTARVILIEREQINEILDLLRRGEGFIVLDGPPKTAVAITRRHVFVWRGGWRRPSVIDRKWFSEVMEGLLRSREPKELKKNTGKEIITLRFEPRTET